MRSRRVLRAIARKWKRRRDEQRRRQRAVRRERKADERDPADRRAHELEARMRSDRAASASPVLSSDVAEAVLDERLFHGEVEEAAEEGSGEQDRRVDAELR